MREILFRGKAINRDKREYRTDYKNGDWVYGLLMKKYDPQFERLPAEMSNESGVTGIEVDYKTIGQYVGIVDKNGDKIFEDDIVKVKYINCGESLEDIIVVDHDSVTGGYSPFTWKSECVGCDCSLSIVDVEIIGNIYDNPELLTK